MQTDNHFGRRNFSLVELMVVIAIIGLLSSIVTVSVITRVAQARRSRVKADFVTLRNALNLYRVNQGAYPPQLQDLWIRPSGLRSWGGPYLDQPPPLDPWDRVYEYELNGQGPRLKTLGSDGAPGGEASAEDLESEPLAS